MMRKMMTRTYSFCDSEGGHIANCDMGGENQA